MEVCRNAQFGQYAGHQVELAGRDAAGQDQHVGPQALRDQRLQAVEPIASDAERTRQAAGPRNLGKQHRPVAVANLARAGDLRGIDDLVAGGQHRDARPRMGLHLRPTNGGQQADLRRPQDGARLQDGVAGAHFAAAIEDVEPFLRRSVVNAHPTTVEQMRALDHDDRFGPLRHRHPVMMRVAFPGASGKRGVWPAMISSMMSNSALPCDRSAQRTA